MDYVMFSFNHLAGVLRLCELEGWPSFSADPERAMRALSAPGVLTIVAVERSEVIGFAQVLTDGEIQAYICQMVVATHARGQGIGRELINEAFARSRAQRVDVLALEGSEGFYGSFHHRIMSGYRIYPRNDLARE
jgi:ribosomal protein S18 acetylase RimI-like enzyme